MNIYVHGLGQSAENWHKTLSYLNYDNVLCPELSDMTGNADYDSLYNSFSDLLNKINEPHDLCGLSLGSVLALNYAVDYPDKISSLVLIAPQYKMPVKLLKFQNLIFRLMPSKAFGQTGFAKNDFIKLCKSMMKIDLSERLDKVLCRVMVVCGEKDSVNKKSSLKLSESLKNAELVIIKNSGHEVNTDAPEKLAEVINKFYIKERKNL